MATVLGVTLDGSLPQRTLGRLLDDTVLNAGADTFWVFLVLEVIAIWLLVRWRRLPNGTALLPRRSVLHRSGGTDLLLVTLAVAMGGLLARVTFTEWTADHVGDAVPQWHLLGSVMEGQRWLAYAVGGLLVFVSADFGAFAVHAMFHRVTWLWPFHVVHHDAPVLTPLTSTRVHPVELVTQTAFQSLLAGLVVGLWFSLGAPELSVPELLGTQLLVIGSQAAFSAARHSSVPISFGRLEGVFVSPVMHQRHHSADPAHFNQNYGVTLAVWDRLFGSWFRPARGETMVFGVEGRSGTSVRDALVEPFVTSARIGVRSATRRRRASRSLTAGTGTAS